MKIIAENRLWIERIVVYITLLSDYIERITRTTKTQRGSDAIIDSRDFMYTISRVAKNTKQTTWKCQKKHLGCFATVTTMNGYIIKFAGHHDHPPPFPKDFYTEKC